MNLFYSFLFYRCVVHFTKLLTRATLKTQAGPRFPTPALIQVLIRTMKLLLHAALVARLQIRTMTLTLALSSLNFHLPCKYVARFIVVIKNIPRIKQASSLYQLNRFFAIKGMNRQPTNSLSLLKCCLCA